jgi:hypothetical protein
MNFGVHTESSAKSQQFFLDQINTVDVLAESMEVV